MKSSALEAPGVFFFIITAEADIYNQMTTWLIVF